ncbi:MAG TPA: ABC transporter permease [Candidatus Limnocylindria bacterium]|nr:ABC transporter permease [Candidatus Limnocylindria bacterium]
MTAEIATGDWPPVEEPGLLRSFTASAAAVLNKETRWRMRGRRAFVVVTFYIAVLALIVFAAYQLLYDRAHMEWTEEGLVRQDFASGAMAAVIGQAIFTAILVVQMSLTMLLAPALTSGAVSMEREKQTLELLITTPVSNLGLIVGKLVASLAYLFLLILASIPLMSLVFVFGGIAPEDVVRAYVLLFAAAFGLGSIGLFMSALLKRTQLATALAFIVVLMLAAGSLALHTYMLASSAADGRAVRPQAPEALLWLNPVVAVIDMGCTAIPDSYNVTCGYITGVTNQELDPVNPPRDAFWPRAATAFLLLGVGLTLATTQLIAPSRRIRVRGSAPAAGEQQVEPKDGEGIGPAG